MKKLKFNPFIIPAGIALIGIGKYSLDTINANKAERAYVDEFTINEETNDIIVDNSSDDENLVSETEEISIEDEETLTFENIDFEKLNQTNSDVVGWLQIDDVINEFPIVQGSNNDEYLHTDLYGNYTKNGNPFMDYNDDSMAVGDEEITVIYGHHLKNGNGFSNLCNYKKSDYINKHPYGIYYSENGDIYLLRFFAGLVVDGSETEYLNIDELNEESYNEFISLIESKSTFSTDVDVEYGDDLMALVTCSYETSNSRYILYGKLEKQYTNNKEENTVKVLTR